ncbi:amino acid permease-domain-containing protein [Trametes punicea]|nr:amino acid permease-domain-containing protein [Trametes punicea]
MNVDVAATTQQLRARSGVTATNAPAGLTVRIQPPPFSTLQQFQRQRNRILRFQRRWASIKEDLPPQLSRKHIGMISVGGVIGTGLFLGSADALRNGGPVGSLLGYAIVGSVVYCLCVSIGEMIAYLSVCSMFSGTSLLELLTPPYSPNVGGVVGLADLYVDPALGFSLGWAAWYNWSITLPAEITAAAVVLGYWDATTKLPVAAASGFFLIIATAINCFPSRYYGAVEFYLSCLKVCTIVFIILVGLLVDIGASHQGRIGFRYWKEQPFAPMYFGITGAKGHFLGFWAVIMQAAFSFFGSEVPGIAAGEVIDATRNVPRALRKVWIRITLFYLAGVLCAGLLVPATNPELAGNDKTGRHSPFVIAFNLAGFRVLPDMVNASILISAWSAAASDIYIGSRFLFFLARRGHAPSFLGHLFKLNETRATHSAPESEEGTPDASDVGSDDNESDYGEAPPSSAHGASLEDGLSEDSSIAKQSTYVLPLASVLVSASVGFLTFLSSAAGSANSAFQWLVAVASVASLQSWAAMLFTYIRWYQGTVHAEKRCADMSEEDASIVMQQIKEIKKNRCCAQPYIAWYAFSLCIVVLFTNGWAVFIHNGWRIAEVMGDVVPQYDGTQREADPVSQFLSAYVPIPFFLLLTFGYKLIKQTKMWSLDDMVFDRGRVPPYHGDIEAPKNWLERFLQWLRLI